jgi:hypothetical protein
VMSHPILSLHRCEQMLLRTHSILHIKLSDLNYNNTYAFNQGVDAQGRDAIDAAMLCLVYQKLLHKERNMANAWRHKPFLQC